MDDMLTESLAGFDAVWRRVTGRGDMPGDDAPLALTEALRALMGGEACAAATASSLARAFRGDDRAALLRHAAEARRHLRRLRAEYFIATGSGGVPMGDCPPSAGALNGLRALLLQAEDMAARYERAAERADSGELRQTLAAFAEDERRRARETRALLIGRF